MKDMFDGEADYIYALRRAAEYAAIIYAESHPGPHIWVIGELGILQLEREEDDAGRLFWSPLWLRPAPTPIVITRAVERARRRWNYVPDALSGR